MKKRIKTINFRLLLWFSVVFVIGAVAVSLMTHSVVGYSVSTVWPLYLGIALFGAFGSVGLVGTIVLLRKHLILKYVIEYGTETVGKYEDLGRIFSWHSGRYGHGTTIWYNQIIFSYMADGEEREYKSCTVYLDNDVDKLNESETFAVKYKGKHAVICEML